jgi:hypothetical protein
MPYVYMRYYVKAHYLQVLFFLLKKLNPRANYTHPPHLKG